MFKLPRWATYAIIAAVILLAMLALSRCDRDRAVTSDRAASTADALNVTSAADRKAGLDQQNDELVRQRAHDDAMENINASERDPAGDPLASAFDSVR